MKVKISIELWDDTPIEDIGSTEEFARLVYEDTDNKLAEAAFELGIEYKMHIEVEDNTKQN